MVIFTEKSDFYRKHVIKSTKKDFKRCFLLVIISSCFFTLFGIKNLSVLGLIIGFILVVITLFWICVTFQSMNVNLKKIKEKYYPNGQLKYKVSFIRINPGINQKGPFNFRTEEKWYENGQIKSSKSYRGRKLESEEYWDKNGNEKLKKYEHKLH